MNKRVFFILAGFVCFGSALVARSLSARAEGCSGRDDCGGGDGSGGKGGPTGTHCGANGESCCTGEGQPQCEPHNLCGGNHRCDLDNKLHVVCNNPERSVFFVDMFDDMNALCRQVGATLIEHTVCKSSCQTWKDYLFDVGLGWYTP